jgi:hypothetical protein
MNARELGRQAALLKLAHDGATTFGATTAPTQPAAPAPAPAGAVPRAPSQVPQQPAARPAPIAGAPVGPRPPGPGGLAGAFQGLRTPQGLAQIISNPALQGLAKPALGIGGLPLLAGGSDLLLHGGQNMQSILRGKPQMG